jgi:alpha-L-arabinofuranosidase
MTELRKENGRDKPWNVKFWAVGNESWGCGGNMTPDYYADVFKRFSTFMCGNGLYKVASGGTDSDFDWTKTILKETQRYPDLIQGYSFHYYTFCHGWNDKTSATKFNENDWFYTMKNTLLMQERLEKHITLMDEYDPPNNRSVEKDLRDSADLIKTSGQIISPPNDNDYNDFGKSKKVNIQKFTSYSIQNNILKVDLPSKSVVTIDWISQ